MNANELAEIIEHLENARYIGASKAATMLRKQTEEIEYWKDKFNKAMELQEPKPAKYTDAWWKEVEEFNKQLKEQQ